MGLVQGEPFLRLLVGLVVKFMVDRAERSDSSKSRRTLSGNWLEWMVTLAVDMDFNAPAGLRLRAGGGLLARW